MNLPFQIQFNNNFYVVKQGLGHVSSSLTEEDRFVSRANSQHTALEWFANLCYSVENVPVPGSYLLNLNVKVEGTLRHLAIPCLF